MFHNHRLCKRDKIGQRGAVLLVVLVMISILGLAMAKAGQSWRTIMQQAREAELLWRGRQFQKAIESYYNVRQGARQMFPASLDDLVRDPRFPGVVRHLRKVYMDPITNADFEVVKDPAERIIGVRSTSILEPFKKDGFPKELEDLKGKTSYRDWEFAYKPPRATRRTSPGSVGQPGQGGLSQPGQGGLTQPGQGGAIQPGRGEPIPPPAGDSVLGVPDQPFEGGQGTIRMPAARKPTP